MWQLQFSGLLHSKEAQKCFCEAPTCRGWLGEQPSESEDEDEEEEEEDEEAKKEAAKSRVVEDTAIPVQISDKTVVPTDIDNVPAVKDADKTVEVAPLETTPSLEKKKKKKARKDVLYEVDFDVSLARKAKKFSIKGLFFLES